MKYIIKMLGCELYLTDFDDRTGPWQWTDKKKKATRFPYYTNAFKVHNQIQNQSEIVDVEA